MNGASVQLADYKGKVILLNFWATWCGPCKMEIPEFVEAYAEYKDRGSSSSASRSTTPPKDAARVHAAKKQDELSRAADAGRASTRRSVRSWRCRHRSSSAATARSARSISGRSRRSRSSGRSRRSCSMIPSDVERVHARAPRLRLPHRLPRRRGGQPGHRRRRQKGPGCPLTLHVRDLPLFDHREALRPSTRLLPPERRTNTKSPERCRSRQASVFTSPSPSRSLLQRPPQQELDLAVEAAQVVVCPALNRVEHLAVDPKQERLALGHGALLIDRAGVDDRLRRRARRTAPPAGCSPSPPCARRRA